MHKLLCGLILLLLSAVSAVQAQGGSRTLAPGQPISGVIDADHLMQMYTFRSAPPSRQRVVFQNHGAIALAASVVDAAGDPVVTMNPVAAGQSGGVDWPSPAPGSYYLIVVPAEALSGGAGGAFTLTLTSQSLASTLQFVLTWQAGARLSLEVRDPAGEALHWRSVQTDDGGSFSGNTDPITCAAFAPHMQTQTATWQAGSTGSYEILVHYIDGCAASLPFTVSVRLGDQTFPALSGTAQADQTFVGGFVVAADGTGALDARSGMIGADEGLTIATADLLASAQPLPASGTAQDRIDGAQPYRSYSFDGQIGELISVSAVHTSGSLDTYLALIDANGNLIANNDDRADDTTDSAINGLRLPRSGRYLIVVTRYGQLVGATEGEFDLTVKTG